MIRDRLQSHKRRKRSDGSNIVLLMRNPQKLFMRITRGRKSVGVCDRILSRARYNVWVIGRGSTQTALDVSNVRRSGSQVIRDRLESHKRRKDQIVQTLFF